MHGTLLEYRKAMALDPKDPKSPSNLAIVFRRSRRLADALKNEAEVQAPPGPGPEASLIAAEERRLNGERIAQTMAKINPRYRRAIEMRLVEERSREECADALEVSVGTFDVLLFRAVRAFRKSFGER